MPDRIRQWAAKLPGAIRHKRGTEPVAGNSLTPKEVLCTDAHKT